MVNGLEKFREYFSEFDGMYMLIGGVACGLIMDEAGLDFRSTKDFDIVLIVEALNEDFAKVFWQFIKDGEYEIRERSNGEPEFYRFKNPKDISYPKQIELFSRKSDVLKYNDVYTYIALYCKLFNISESTTQTTSEKKNARFRYAKPTAPKSKSISPRVFTNYK